MKRAFGCERGPRYEINHGDPAAGVVLLPRPLDSSSSTGFNMSVLIDTGSDSQLIHKDDVEMLQLHARQSTKLIEGINGDVNNPSGELTLGMLDVVLGHGTPHATLVPLSWMVSTNPNLKGRPLLGSNFLTRIDGIIKSGIRDDQPCLDYLTSRTFSKPQSKGDQRHQLPLRSLVGPPLQPVSFTTHLTTVTSNSHDVLDHGNDG